MKNLEILYVEDEKLLREVLTKYLEKIGNNSVTACKDLAEAEEKLSGEKKFDLVLTDFNYPDGTGGNEGGAKLVHLLAGKSPEVPVVMLTGVTDIQKIREKHGLPDSVLVLTKGLRLPEIVSRIERHIKGKENRPVPDKPETTYRSCGWAAMHGVDGKLAL